MKKDTVYYIPKQDMLVRRIEDSNWVEFEYGKYGNGPIPIFKYWICIGEF